MSLGCKATMLPMGGSTRHNRWDEFAQEDAEFYIYTERGVDFKSSSGQALFRRSGRDEVERILRESERYVNGFGRAIEIGCGVGRLALPMAERFADVIGVDISPTMLAKLHENSRADGTSNVRGFLTDDDWYNQGQANLVYSLLVFQHIEDRKVISEYFGRVANCLAEDGVCYAQFDTRRRTWPYFVTHMLPDPMLPKTWRRGIRRIRRQPADLRRMFGSYGLTVLTELRPNSDRHTFLLATKSVSLNRT
jgi:SAM-dependent methyltransferase